jgi:hypothetical protein
MSVRHPKKCQPQIKTCRHFAEPPRSKVHLTVGNRSGYRGNRSYRSGSVRKKLGYRSLTEPIKPLFSVYWSVLPIYRTDFGGLENRSGSGFLNPASIPASPRGDSADFRATAALRGRLDPWPCYLHSISENFPNFTR